MSDYQKYLKYKNKYLELKNQYSKKNKIGGGKRQFGGASLTVDSILPTTTSNKEKEEAFHTWLKNSSIEPTINKILSFFENDGTPNFPISATTFSDYYKFSMAPVFIKLNKHFTDKGTPFYVTFGVDIRTPEIKTLLDGNNLNSTDKADSDELKVLIESNLEKFTRRIFTAQIFSDLYTYKLNVSKKSFNSDTPTTSPNPQTSPPTIPTTSKLCLTPTDIDDIVIDTKTNSPRNIAHESICKKKYIPGLTEPYDINDVVISCYTELNPSTGKNQYFIEATGPWHLVTWLETSMMQNVYETIMTWKRNKAGQTYINWLYNALLRCYKSIEYIKSANANKPADRAGILNGALFTGRRTGGLLFLLLQNYMFRTLLPLPWGVGTSSVDAWYLFKHPAWGIKADNWAPANQLNPVGTHAHEMSMVMSALFPQLDTQLPLTQILGHYLYWKYASMREGDSDKGESTRILKIPMLPDTLGTGAFLMAAKTIMMDSNDTSTTASATTASATTASATTAKTFLETCIYQARQDSGSIEGFVQIMNRHGAFNYTIMASEIDNCGTVDKVIRYRTAENTTYPYPYVSFGAGGFFGDSPKVWGDNEFYLSMAVKPVRVFITNTPKLMGMETEYQNGVVRYPIKLGDLDPAKPNEKGKISIDGTLDKDTSESIENKAKAIRTLGEDPANMVGIDKDKLNMDFKEVIAQIENRSASSSSSSSSSQRAASGNPGGNKYYKLRK
jgi:hypothetical protein